MTTGTKAKRLELAHAAMLSQDTEEVMTALGRIEKEGDVRSIRPLVRALSSAADPQVQQRITSLLNQIKVPEAASELVAVLNDPSYAAVRKVVLATFWNAGLDVRDHLELFVTIALEGDAEECFECLTIVENQEIWPEKAARLALARVRKALADEGDTYKGSMLNDLMAVLQYRLGSEGT